METSYVKRATSARFKGAPDLVQGERDPVSTTTSGSGAVPLFLKKYEPPHQRVASAREYRPPAGRDAAIKFEEKQKLFRNSSAPRERPSDLPMFKSPLGALKTEEDMFSRKPSLAGSLSQGSSPSYSRRGSNASFQKIPTRKGSLNLNDFMAKSMEVFQKQMGSDPSRPLKPSVLQKEVKAGEIDENRTTFQQSGDHFVNKEKKKKKAQPYSGLKKIVIDKDAEVNGLNFFPDIAASDGKNETPKSPSTPGNKGKNGVAWLSFRDKQSTVKKNSAKEDPENQPKKERWGILKKAKVPTKWQPLKSASEVSKAFKEAGQENQVRVTNRAGVALAENCSTQRRGTYADQVRTNMLNSNKVSGTIKLERFILRVADLLALRKLFDEMDLDGDGTVSMDEVCYHRSNMRKLRARVKEDFVWGVDDKCESIIMVILSADEDITFADLMFVVYPKLTAKDIETCEAYLPKKKAAKKERKRFSQNFWKEYEMADMYYKQYADRDGIISEKKFASLCKAMFGGEGVKFYYQNIANVETTFIHRKEFNLWWMNVYRETAVEWEELQEDAEQFFKENPFVYQAGSSALYMHTMK